MQFNISNSNNQVYQSNANNLHIAVWAEITNNNENLL